MMTNLKKNPVQVIAKDKTEYTAIREQWNRVSVMAEILLEELTDFRAYEVLEDEDDNNFAYLDESLRELLSGTIEILIEPED